MGAWDLTSAARPAFHFFSLVPNQFPSQAGTHDDVPVRMVVRACARPYPYAVLPTSSEVCGQSGHCHPSTLASNSSLNAYSRNSTNNRQTGGCPWLRTSDLYHLPIAVTVHRGTQLGVKVCAFILARPIVAIFPYTPFEMHASLADLGLTICRVVTDLTPNYTFPPVLDSHLSCDRSC